MTNEPECFEPCFSCNGAGGYEDYDGEWVTCYTCNGGCLCDCGGVAP